MICRNPIPLGGRVRLDVSSGRSFRRSWSSLGRFRVWRPQRYLSVDAPSSVPRPWRYPESRGYWWVGRAVIPQIGPGHRYLTGTRSLAGPRPWQDPEGRGNWCVGWSVCLSGEKVRFTLPRWEPGETWIRRARCHAPPPRPMVNGISHWSEDELVAGLVYAIRIVTDWHGRKRLGLVWFSWNGWVWLGTVLVTSVLSRCSLSSTQSGEPDAGCQLSLWVDHGGSTHRSTLDVAGPGGPVPGRFRRLVSVGHHLAPPGVTPSQGNLTLGVLSHRESTMGEPINRRSVRLHQVLRWGSEIPSYGGTHQERHLHTVRLERRSSVTRIVAPAELPRLGVLTLHIYRSRRVGVVARAARRPEGYSRESRWWEYPSERRGRGAVA